MSVQCLLFVIIQTITMQFIIAENLHGQNLKDTKVTLRLENEKLTEIFKVIEDKTDFAFVYPEEVRSNSATFSLNTDNESLESILRTLRAKAKLKFKVSNYTITAAFDSKIFNPTSAKALPVQVDPLIVTGIVNDEQGNPLPGASVLLKGTGTGTTTNSDGKYSIEVDGENAVLIFSFIGYETQQILVGDKTNIDLTLKPDTSTLQEIVVVGYGTQDKRDVTGSISSINLSKIEGVPFRSVDQVLQGRSAGVFYVQNSGMPGAGASVRIRGGNSINGSNEPLYVIDGIPITAGGGDATSLNPLNILNPNDIESIEVLKDASATSIYGSRGGNGVVLITTKRGKEGKGRISINAYYGLQKETNRYKLLDAKQFETLANEASQADGGPLLYDPALNPVSTDWQEAMFRGLAPVQNYNISASGGGAATNYLTSFDYYNQKGIIRSSDLERYSYRLNLDKTISNKIEVGNSLTASYVETNRANSSSIFSMLATPPNLQIKQPDGSYTQYNNLGLGFNNPVALLNGYQNLNKTFRAIGNTYVNIKLADALTFRTTWGLDASFNKNVTYMPQTVFSGSQVGGDASVFSAQTFTWLNENTLNYKQEFNQHRIDVLAGFTQQSSRYESFGASATGFLNDVTRTYDLGLGNSEAAVLPNSSTANWTIHSYLGRVNYGFKDRYLITATVRADGSSRFGENNRFGFFPSLALAWRPIEEDLVKNLGLFSDLKIRGSYGVTGNQDGIGNFPALDLWDGVKYVIGDQIVMGITPSQVGNKNLKWERTTQWDVGVDMSFFQNRLTVVADGYYKQTNDLLLRVQIPATSGFNTGMKNIGSIENRGLEFSVDGVIADAGFKWTSGFNLTFNKNKILSLGGEDQILPASSPTILKVNQSLGTFYGYISDGLFQAQQEVMESAQTGARTGDVRFIDFDGNGVINENDQRIIGNAQPEFFGGFNNSFSFKGIELSFLLQFVYGNDLYNLNLKTLENLRGIQNQRTTVLNRWTPENTDTSIPRASADKASDISYDRYIENGSYLRLKNVQLAYSVPSSIISQIGINNLKIYVNAQNIFTWTNYSGIDPEVSRYGSDNINQGFDSGAYPNAKMYSAGFNMNF